MNPQTDMEKLAEKLYADVKSSFTDNTLNIGNIFSFVRLAMETAEKIETLAGRDKKKLVIRICQEALEDLVLDDQVQLKIFIDTFLDMTIDQFVAIDLGNLAINDEQKHKIKTFFKKIVTCQCK